MIDNDPEKDPGRDAETSSEDAKKPGDLENTPEKELTPEEQMAKFEDSLKDEDWGHQPC